MEKINLIETFSDFKEFRNIDRETMMHILEDVFKHMLLKKYGSIDNFDIIINIDKGDLEILRNREIVENVEDENTQISFFDAIKIEPDFKIGEEVSEEISLSNFGRREILAIHQNLITKLSEYEKNSIYTKYQSKIGEIVSGEIFQVFKKDVLILDDENVELFLPKEQQIPSEYYRKGDTIRAIVLKVENIRNKPVIFLSRTSPIFLEKLLESEIPEVYDGLITIKKIVRAPGERAKVSVESYDDRIDGVGTCVGVKGCRIHGIVRELKNESIDIINYTENINLYIQRALSPAKISFINFEDKKANVFMKTDQFSLAIGKGGNNIKLASKLTGYDIEVYQDSNDVTEEDVELQDFSDEIDQFLIDELKTIGCDTAKSVLALEIDDIVKRTDLKKETIVDIFRILKSEFE